MDAQDLTVPTGHRPDRLGAFLRRRWRSLSVGGISGLAIGISAGYYASAPGFEGLPILLPMGAGGLLFVVFGFAAFWRPQSAASAMLMLVVGSVVGFNVAPGAPGSDQRARGTLTVGTFEGSGSLWSGQVSCEWEKDRSAQVKVIRGFSVTIDNLTYTVLWVEGAVTHPLPDANGYASKPVDLANVSPDGRTGTAVFPEAGGIWFRWSCTDGP